MNQALIVFLFITSVCATSAYASELSKPSSKSTLTGQVTEDPAEDTSEKSPDKGAKEAEEEITEPLKKELLEPMTASFGGFGDFDFDQPSMAEAAIIAKSSDAVAADASLRAHDFGIFGDNIDPYTGGLSFSHIDVSLPGNSHLEVAVRRSVSQATTYHPQQSRGFGDWELDVPRIHRKVAQPVLFNSSGFANIKKIGIIITQFGRAAPNWRADRCSRKDAGYHYYQRPSRWVTPSGALLLGNTNWNSYTIVPEWFYDEDTYADGTHLSIPGQGSQEILDTPRGGIWHGSPKKVTKNHWKFECIANISDGGEGFIAIAPNGDRWKFDKLVYRQAPYKKVYPKGMAIGSPTAIYSVTGMSHATMLATEVTDVNGNWVKYRYTDNGQLTQIESNDGRKIDLFYVNNNIDRVVAHGRTWQYDYHAASAVRPAVLKEVTLPDGRSWTFDLQRLYWEAMPGQACNLSDFSVSLTHPDGAKAEFGLAETVRVAPSRLGGTSVNSRCAYDPTSAGWAYNSGWHRVYETVSVTDKTISATDIPTSTWRYAYNGKRVTITDPMNRRTIQEFYSSGAGEGQAKYTWTYEDSGLLRTEYYKYIHGPIMGDTFRWLHPEHGDIRADLLSEVHIIQGGHTYKTINTYNTDLTSPLYSYGKPIKIEQFSTLQAPKRIAQRTYKHIKSIWKLALPERSILNSKEFEHYGYDSRGNHTWLNRFNTRTLTNTYHSDGTLASAKDAEENKTYYTNYQSGTPQLVRRADNRTVMRTIDAFGQMTSQTDSEGLTIGYQYDVAGRLSDINLPSPWHDTHISYSNLGAGLTQVSTTGPSQTTTTHDQLLRPILIKNEATYGGGKTSYVKTTYDPLGRTYFASQPATVPNPTLGSYTYYDGLGRVTKTRDNMAPYAQTLSAYLAGNVTRTTDADNYVTSTFYSGYGSPEDGKVIKIVSPHNVTTQMTYAIWGNMLTLRQHGTQHNRTVDQTQYYFYDNAMRLCRHRTPETGDTAYTYYDTGHIKTTAKGLPALNGCGTPTGNTAVTSYYDNLNRLTLLDYADPATPDTTYAYSPMGNVTNLNREGADWTYVYDDMYNLKQESLKLDGYTWQTDYTYNKSMQMTSVTLPSRRKIDYSLNGLGQVLSVASNGQVYANNMAYHVNGAWSQMRYGNGHTLQQSLDARLLPKQLWTSHASKPSAVNYTHHYDRRGNLKSIIDSLSSANTRTFVYDGLSRLTSATGPFGNASFEYDALGNIRQKRLGSRTVNINYNSLNRVSSASSTGTGVPTATSASFNATYQYDTRGNTLNSGRVNFIYDASDQPTRMTHNSGVSNYLYDGHKRRVKQVVSSNSSTKTTYSIYSQGGTLLHRHNISENKKTDYIQLGGSNTGSIRLEDGIPRYVHVDHLGSPVAETSQTGAIVWKERYTPFGETLDNPDGNKDDQGYTGHVSDSETGLVYMQARYYDPVIGRFYSNDPVGFKNVHNFNRYAYANNNPYKYVDPDGREATAYYSGSNGAFLIRDNDTGAYAYSTNFFSGKQGLNSSQTDGPVPSGSYSILSRSGTMAGAQAFRLEANDSSFGDDATDGGRNQIRLHQGTVSLGCITCLINKEFAGVIGVLNNTSTSESSVDRKGTLGKLGFSETLSNYGNLNVLGDSSSLQFNSQTNEFSIQTTTDQGTTSQKICTVGEGGSCQ
ncbi:DUF2778 domain-containing protein [Glaciecola sp. MH2013]|uniref:RHS repeat domain-containing protein n=1 Tax=Glaciecola sp. MH2013 TaxID=2785524 RepID=UPI00189F397B|nr:RHS repeat-associated core domain-containing protein [Glaciecola sp. MH2013]MBF7074233.1 DUF2778 domain-containing protein [Glaciecola sp. MH2013]